MVGEVITYGHYEQDNNLANGKEDIQWRVLAISSGKALLVSEKILDCKPYNTTLANVTWATCTLRTWLNAGFMDAAFSTSEKASIVTTTVSNPNNPTFGTSGGAFTSDQVFLLSIGETETYFTTDASRIAYATAYGKAMGATEFREWGGWWWLRSPGQAANLAAAVNYYGSIDYYGDVVNYSGSYAVRPALWLDISP